MIEAALLLSFAVFPGTASDRLGDRLGGLSDLRWDDSARELYALPDRGPGDGTVPYAPRFQVFSAEVSSAGVSLALSRTVLFLDEEGRPFTGLIASTMSRLDPEGLVLAPDGTLWVSDEYGPEVLNFSREGRLLGRLAVPPAYRPGEGRGRDDNRGFEGLCLSRDGRRLHALLQSPLLQDGGRTGGATRLLSWDLERPTRLPREDRVPMPRAEAFPPRLAYRQAEFGFNACETLEDGRLLLLERDGRRDGDPGPAHKRVVLVRLSEDGRAVEEGALDLLAPLRAAGLPTAALPEKFESLAWGPALGGRPTLWSAVDNDFVPESPTAVLLYRLSRRPAAAGR